MKRALAALSTAALFTLVACSANAGGNGADAGEPAHVAAVAACVRPADTATTAQVLDYVDCLTGVTPSETPTPTQTPTQTPTSTPTETEPPTPAKVIGMSAPANLWSQRLGEVGACGVEARRIFADLTSDGHSQSTLIQQAVNAGMMPVISYKAPSAATAASGGYDSWMTAVKTYLTSLGVPVTATYWHEPHGDMTAQQFQQGSQRFLDRVKAPNVKVGPILNGWLLDNQVSTFASYTNPTLLAGWDFVAVDSYQNGSQSSPGTKLPARGVTLLETWLDGQGFGDKPIGLGEYNGFTGPAIAAAGETLLSTPEVWFGLAWNSTGGTYAPLTGDRLTAYKATKADSRALHSPAC